jgi:ABC-type dipeptide/oligopeptide/nickel transport system permease component
MSDSGFRRNVGDIYALLGYSVPVQLFCLLLLHFVARLLKLTPSNDVENLV